MWPSWVKAHSSDTAAASTSTALVPAAGAGASPRLSIPNPSLKDLRSLLAPDSAATAPPSASPSPRVLHRIRVAASALRALRTLHQPPSRPPAAAAGKEPVPGGGRVVLYFTSLRVVRGTYEDCRAVRAILRGLRAAVDERDLAMDPGYLPELASLLPHAPRGRVALPQVFVGGRHVGGAEEVRRLHEAGELRRIVAPASSGGSCARCGAQRYVLCAACHGSHKRYSLKGGGGFRSCAECNENGLVRCPACCVVPAS